MLSEPETDSEAHHRIPLQDVRFVAQLRLLRGEIALRLIAGGRARGRGRSALCGQRDARRAAVNGADIEEEVNATVLASRISPAEADIRRHRVAELKLTGQGAELRARVRVPVDRVGALVRKSRHIE